MEKPRWSILCLGIIFFILNGVNGVTDIISCSVTAGADRESLTINVTYNGDYHMETGMHFYDPLRTITAIEAPCETSSSSPDLTFISCYNDNTPSTFRMRLDYDLTSLTNTNITLRKFNFPIESQLYSSGSIRLQARNSTSDWGSHVYCSAFSSPPAFILLGNLYIYKYIYILDLDLHMVNTSMTYEKTDIMIEFETNAAILASPGSKANYTFKFPPGTLTSLSLCTVYTYIYIYIIKSLCRIYA